MENATLPTSVRVNPALRDPRVGSTTVTRCVSRSMDSVQDPTTVFAKLDGVGQIVPRVSNGWLGLFKNQLLKYSVGLTENHS